MTVSPAILDLDEDHCIACWKTLFVQIWGKHTVKEAVAHARRYASDFARGNSAHMTLFIVTADALNPDKDARPELDELTRDLLKSSTAFAYVYEGQGLHATAMRSTLVAMGIAEPGAAYRVCKSVDEALAWLTRTASDARHGTAYERAHAVRVIRQRFYARRQLGPVRQQMPA